jgi:long-subunit acyl-CoA synthetase (AMP-forming)
MRLWTRQDPHRCLCLELQKDLSAFRPRLFMVGVPAVWESFCKGIVAPIAKAIFIGAMYVHPGSAQVADNLASFCRK